MKGRDKRKKAKAKREAELKRMETIIFSGPKLGLPRAA